MRSLVSVLRNSDKGNPPFVYPLYSYKAKTGRFYSRKHKEFEKRTHIYTSSNIS